MGDRQQLTERQQDVLDLLLQGDSQALIARKLEIGAKTVNTHVQAVYDHFAVSSHAKLILRAFRLGMLTTEDRAAGHSQRDGGESVRLSALPATNSQQGGSARDAELLPAADGVSR